MSPNSTPKAPPLKKRRRVTDESNAATPQGQQVNAIPGWQVAQTAQRRLSCDMARVFDALSREDDRLTPERFLEACTTNLGEVRKLLAGQNPQWNVDQIEHVLNRVLADLISYEHVAHLARSKDKDHSLSLPCTYSN